MKKLTLVLLILSLLVTGSALADPLPLLEDYIGEVAEFMDESDPSALRGQALTVY